MEEIGRGITVTRTIELPFTPTPEISIAGMQLDDCPEPIGFKLFDLTWDVDRQVFLAHTFMLSHGACFAMIPDEVGRWVELGWRLGSYMEAYVVPDDSSSEEGEPKSGEVEITEWDEMERWPSMSPRNRPAAFNRILRAIVRTMVELDNNTSVAYAIFKTKRFFTEEEQKNNWNAAPVRRFREAESEYHSMQFEKQIAWKKRILRTYPNLKSLLPTS